MSKLTQRVLRDYGSRAHSAHLIIKNQVLDELRPFMARCDFGAIVSQTLSLLERPDDIPIGAWPTVLSSILGFLNSENSAAVKKNGGKIVSEHIVAKPPRKKSSPPAPRKPRDRRQKYEDYINSKAWQRRRLALFAKRGRRCESCGESRGEIHVHHLTYANFGNEKDMDLLVLCRACHMARHKS